MKMETGKLVYFISAIVLICVLVVAGFLVLGGIQNFISSYATATEINETITPLNGTNVSLTYSNVSSITSVYNGTTGIINSGNYTYYGPEGYFKLLNNAYNASSFKVTYEYYYVEKTAEYNATTITINALTQIPTWIPIIIVIFIAGILIALVMKFVPSRGQGG